MIARGIPALVLHRRILTEAERIVLALLSATGLPLIVVITAIGQAGGRMRPENAAALVGAGMLSVLLFPTTSLRLLRQHSGEVERPTE